jgi:hypothetical protein
MPSNANEAPGSDEGRSWGGSIVNKVNHPHLHQERQEIAWQFSSMTREELLPPRRASYHHHWRSSLSAENWPGTRLPIGRETEPNTCCIEIALRRHAPVHESEGGLCMSLKNLQLHEHEPFAQVVGYFNCYIHKKDHTLFPCPSLIEVSRWNVFKCKA